MLLQLQRLILNYPEEVTLELFPSQPTGEGEGDDEEGKAFRLAIQALESFGSSTVQGSPSWKSAPEAVN